jgi:hypothetical protein
MRINQGGLQKRKLSLRISKSSKSSLGLADFGERQDRTQPFKCLRIRASGSTIYAVLDIEKRHELARYAVNAESRDWVAVDGGIGSVGKARRG